MTFHTARSTAFPQPAPGTAPAPGPKLVPAGELRKWLGVREVAYSVSPTDLAVTDSTCMRATRMRVIRALVLPLPLCARPDPPSRSAGRRP